MLINKSVKTQNIQFTEWYDSRQLFISNKTAATISLFHGMYKWLNHVISTKKQRNFSWSRSQSRTMWSTIFSSISLQRINWIDLNQVSTNLARIGATFHCPCAKCVPSNAFIIWIWSVTNFPWHNWDINDHQLNGLWSIFSSNHIQFNYSRKN